MYPRYLCGQFCLYGHNLVKYNIHKRGTFTNSRICSTFINNLNEGKKQVLMTKSMNSLESIETLTVINQIKLICFFDLPNLLMRGIRTGNFD